MLSRSLACGMRGVETLAPDPAASFPLLLGGGLLGCGYADLQKLGRVAAHDRRLVIVRKAGCAGDEADRVRLRHVEGIVTVQEDVIAAPDLRQIFELMM